MTKTEATHRYQLFHALMTLGIAFDDAEQLRRISNRLHRWYELECGTVSGCIERDDKTDKPYWFNPNTMHRSPMADWEKGALKRLTKIMAGYPHLTHYLQTDPRGAALYILRPGDVPEGQNVEAYYNRGICVY